MNELCSAYCLLIGVPPALNFLTHNTSFGKFTDKWLNQIVICLGDSMILQPSDFMISQSRNSMISQPGRTQAQTREGNLQIIYVYTVCCGKEGQRQIHPLLLVLFGCKFIATSMMKIQRAYKDSLIYGEFFFVKHDQ